MNQKRAMTKSEMCADIRKRVNNSRGYTGRVKDDESAIEFASNVAEIGYDGTNLDEIYSDFSVFWSHFHSYQLEQKES